MRNKRPDPALLAGSSSSSSPVAGRPEKSTPAGHAADEAASAVVVFEFFGPHVPGALLLALPAVLYGLILGCHRDACLSLGTTTAAPFFFVTLPDKGR